MITYLHGNGTNHVGLYDFTSPSCVCVSLSHSRLKKANIGFEHMFEEVPIVIKNSHLINVLLWDLEDKSTVADKHELLNLSSRSDMSSCIHLPRRPMVRWLGHKMSFRTDFSSRNKHLQGVFCACRKLCLSVIFYLNSSNLVCSRSHFVCN